jgi:hypothetical protein
MIILTLIMLLILIAPLLYFVCSIYVARALGGSVKAKRTYATICTLIIAAYPCEQIAEVVSLNSHCNSENYLNSPVISLDQQALLLVGEVNRGGMSPPIFRDFLGVKKGYLYTAGLVEGELTPIEDCRTVQDNCDYLAISNMKYYIYISYPHAVSGAGIFHPLESKIQVVDYHTKKVLSERVDYVMGGFVGIYHGLLNGHPGMISCGYVQGSIGAWRPKGNVSRDMAYRKTDTDFIINSFPGLKP